MRARLFKPLYLILAVASFCSVMVFAQGEAVSPAVKDISGKVDGFAGSLDGESFQGGQGSIAFPLTQQWGLQFDALTADLDNSLKDIDLTGASAHLFWRDPNRHLLDFSLSHGDTGEISYILADILFEFYWDNRSLSASLGQIFGDVEDALYGRIQLRQYFRDNFSVQVSLSAADQQNTAELGFEFRTPFDGLYVYGNSYADDDGFDATIFGVRFFFSGETPSPSVRDREYLVPSAQIRGLVSNYKSILAKHNEVLAPSPSASGGNTMIPINGNCSGNLNGSCNGNQWNNNGDTKIPINGNCNGNGNLNGSCNGNQSNNNGNNILF